MLNMRGYPFDVYDKDEGDHSKTDDVAVDNCLTAANKSNDLKPRVPNVSTTRGVELKTRRAAVS